MKDKLNNEEQKENELIVEKKTDSNSELEASKSSPEVSKSKKDIKNNKKKVVKKRLRIIAPVDSSDEEETIQVCINFVCLCTHVCICNYYIYYLHILLNS